jgi:hypothetical protein
VLLSSGRSGGGGSPGKKPLQYLLHALSINTSIGIAQRRRISANPELLGSSSLHYTTRRAENQDHAEAAPSQFLAAHVSLFSSMVVVCTKNVCGCDG